MTISIEWLEEDEEGSDLDGGEEVEDLGVKGRRSKT